LRAGVRLVDCRAHGIGDAVGIQIADRSGGGGTAI